MEEHKMKKKTLICLLLTLTLVTASCGNTSGGNETTAKDPVTTEPEETTEDRRSCPTFHPDSDSMGRRYDYSKAPNSL